LLNPHAARQVARILHTTLAAAATWADCAKDVTPGPNGFSYVSDPRFHLACAAFETPAGVARMVDFVSRNGDTCAPGGHVTACHKEYHYTDIAVQHDHYDRGFIGTGDHDVVSALNAAIDVLRGRPAPPPFSIRNKPEALLLLTHLVGDVHQPLHVGAIYLDAHGRAVDPDLNGSAPDLATATRGGNALDVGTTNLHAEWDAVPTDLQPDRIDGDILAAARQVATSPNDLRTWSAHWATETLIASQAAFAGLSFSRDARRPGHWTIQFTDEDGYVQRKTAIQRQQLIKAGARLAQLLNALWP